MEIKIVQDSINPKDWAENVIACGSQNTFCLMIPKSHINDLENVSIMRTSEMRAGDLIKAIRGEMERHVCLFFRIEKDGGKDD